MPAPLECPEMERWQAMFEDTIPPDQQEIYERHLESCSRCQERLDRTDEFGNALRILVREVGGSSVAPVDPVLTQIMEQLRDATSPLRSTLGEPADLYFLRPAERPDILGMLGAYEVEEVIGQGGMGVVLKAFDPALHRLVAIKVMAAAVAGSATARQRFTREAKAAAAVCHEHIVTVHGVFEMDGLPYLVMQYVAGESLQARLDRSGPLEVEDIVRIGLQTASGLAAAHAQGLIHRDIKPANLLLENGLARVRITDFGLARMTDDVQLTQNGVVAGTPEYMAPEQARGETVDHRADLFSLGSVLYSLCTGVPPFRGSSTVAMLRQVSDQIPTPIRELNPAVPAWLETLIARLMAKNPADRFQSAAEVAELLERYLAHLRQPATVLPPPITIPSNEQDHKLMGQRWWLFNLLGSLSPWLLGSVILIVLGLSSSLLILVQLLSEPQPSAQEFYQDFRGKKYSDRLFSSEGPDAAELIKSDPEGLRITLPAKQLNPGPVGLETTFPIKGNFEITIGYAILQADQPKAGWGVGFEVWLLTDTPTDEAASFLHLVRPNGGNVYASTRMTMPQGKLQQVAGLNLPDLPAASMSGHLRVTRTGSEAVLSAAEENSTEYHEMYRFDLGFADVIRLRMAAIPGNAANIVDLRVHDLRIRALGLPRILDSTGEEVTEAPRRHVWLSVGLIAGGLLFFGLWVRWRISHTATNEEPAQSVPVASASAKATPAAALLVAFSCSSCGKNLKVRAELVGKKVKCPQCGQAVPVPLT